MKDIFWNLIAQLDQEYYFKFEVLRQLLVSKYHKKLTNKDLVKCLIGDAYTRLSPNKKIPIKDFDEIIPTIPNMIIHDGKKLSRRLNKRNKNNESDIDNDFVIGKNY